MARARAGEPEPLALALDRPPPAAALLRLPEGFGRRFAIFADAEEEFDWAAPFSRTATATTAIAALPEATRRFNAAGTRPCYLADWPVIDTPASGAILRALTEAGACSIGAQLHPWVTPPHEEEVCAANSFVGRLPEPLEGAKLARLAARIAEVIGARPIAYRAGRYGVGPNSARLLRAEGFRLDLSTRPLFSYAAEGGPDFTAFPNRAWRIAPGLSEVPASVTFVGRLRRRGRALYARPRWRGALNRLGLVSRVALTPEGIPTRDALRAIDALAADGAALLALSFHTPSLVPGHTPYVRDAGDLRRFWRWWDQVFARLARRGYAPCTPAEIADAADAATLVSDPAAPLDRRGVGP